MALFIFPPFGFRFLPELPSSQRRLPKTGVSSLTDVSAELFDFIYPKPSVEVMHRFSKLAPWMTKTAADPSVTPEFVVKHGLTAEEFERIKKILGREPNFTELGIFSVMWSEHC